MEQIGKIVEHSEVKPAVDAKTEFWEGIERKADGNIKERWERIFDTAEKQLAVNVADRGNTKEGSLSTRLEEPANTGALQANEWYRQCETSGTEHDLRTRTDSEGRIAEVYSPELHKSIGGRTPKHMTISDLENVGYRGHTRPGDEGGHLASDSVGGSRYNDNIVPMKGELNRGTGSAWRKMEIERDALISQGRDVTNYRVEVLYEDSISKRPSGFNVTYNVDGKPYYKEHFSNE